MARPRKPKLDELIGHRPLGRPLEIDELVDEFLLIREAQGEKRSTAHDFELVGKNSGTHLLKLVSSKAEAGRHVLRFDLEEDGRASRFLPSTDVKQIPAAKIAFRPLEVEGDEPKSLVDHVLYPDNRSSAVLEAFENAYGTEALTRLRTTLTTTLESVKELPATEFPIVFLPNSDGGDLQATPVSPAMAYEAMHAVVNGYFAKRGEDDSPSLHDRWHRQFVSGKMQNVSSAVGKRRIRFAASMPTVPPDWDAALHRYANGGAFPYWNADGISSDVEAYAELLEQRERYANRDIRTGLDRRADSLVRSAREFAADAVEQARERYPDISLAAPPDVATLLLRRRWASADNFDRARRALTSDHFKSRATDAAIT